MIILDCSQPLYYSTHAKEKATEAIRELEARGGKGGEANEASQTKSPPRTRQVSCCALAGVQLSRE